MPRRITKRIHLEKHALMRMKQRGIEQSLVEKAIADPHTRSPAKRQGAVTITHQLNAQEKLTVIIEETDDFIRVVTAWI